MLKTSIEAVIEQHCVMQDLKKAALLVYANKQDVRGAMTAADISHELGLTRIKDHTWHIQACCALTGEGFVSTALSIASLRSKKASVFYCTRETVGD